MIAHAMPPVEVLRRYFRIDGQWRLERRTRAHGWRLASRIQTGQRYFTVGFEGKRYLAHRIIWTLHHGKPPVGVIDHINGQPWDNSIENLRDVTPTQNRWNSRPAGRNRTGFRNVHEFGSGFRGRVIVDYGHHYTPVFDDPELAELAVSELKLRLRGEFAFEHREAA